METLLASLGEERRSIDLELVNLIVILTYGTTSLSFLLYLPPNNIKIPLQEFINRTLVHHHWDSELQWQYPYIKESGFLVLSAVTSPSKPHLLIFMNLNKSLREKWWKKGRYNYWSNQMRQAGCLFQTVLIVYTWKSLSLCNASWRLNRWFNSK